MAISRLLASGWVGAVPFQAPEDEPSFEPTTNPERASCFFHRCVIPFLLHTRDLQSCAQQHALLGTRGQTEAIISCFQNARCWLEGSESPP